MILVLRYLKIRDYKEDSPLTSGIDLLSTADQYSPYSNFTKCEELSFKMQRCKKKTDNGIKTSNNLPTITLCFIDRIAD